MLLPNLTMETVARILLHRVYRCAPTVFVYEVDWSTHDDVKQGREVLGTAVVRVTADSETEASLAAAQMVGSHRPMVTATRRI